MNKNMLPAGFYDLIFDEAKKSYEDSNAAISLLISEKYFLIKPPLIEFDSDYQTASESDYFVTTDGVSGKKIALRSDITLQIRRILATRLKNQELPLKLCYVGDVIKAKSEDLYADRQQTQIGFEIIGIQDDGADFLIIKDLIDILQKIKVKNFIFNVTLPNFLDVFLTEIKIEEQKSLKTAILQKNLSKIAKICPNYSDILQKIVRFNDDLPKIIAEIKQKIISKEMNVELSRVQNIYEFFQKNYPNLEINFDLFGDKSSEYHCDIYFEILVPNFSYAIAKGGRYKIPNDDKGFIAVGATIYMNNLRKL